MQPLSAGRLRAPRLRAPRNLADRRAGNWTAFLNIADARFLTEAGLAERSRQGWDTVPAGSAYLAGLDPPAVSDASLSQLHPPNGEDRGA